jgi:protein-S-isoprenylcysteine O-methyltransferase Ste14
MSMRPLPFTHPAAGVVFDCALGLFVAVQVGMSVVVLRHARSRRRSGGRRMDRGTMPLIVVATGFGLGAALAVSTAVKAATVTPGIAAVRWVVFGVGVVAIVTGSLLRQWAITTLGRFFTPDVRVARDQLVVTGGPYRWVRHPSYTGFLLAVVGFGLALGNWLSILIVAVVPLLALVARIHVEEAALLSNLGEPYARFAAPRKRLVPGVW